MFLFVFAFSLLFDYLNFNAAFHIALYTFVEEVQEVDETFDLNLCFCLCDFCYEAQCYDYEYWFSYFRKMTFKKKDCVAKRHVKHQPLKKNEGYFFDFFFQNSLKPDQVILWS